METNLPITRSALLRAMQAQSYDVIVIGGGATGLGIALDAQHKGLKTLLVEKYDFSKGTSSRSTKLLHGGVRYLQQGNLRLVFEALHERTTAIHNAPHLAHYLRFIIPTTRWFDMFFYGIGLKLYDILSGFRHNHRSYLTGAQRTLALAPFLKTSDLKGSVVYYDGQFNDTRMAITLLKTFEQLGGIALNYMEVVDFLKTTDQKISGVLLLDGETKQSYSVSCPIVINATGIFSDIVQKKDNPDTPSYIKQAQGSHIVVSQKALPCTDAILVPKTSDKRILFIVPWSGYTLIGTTDIGVDSPSIDPVPSDDEIDYMLKTASDYLEKPLTRADILSVFAGQRPLVAKGDGHGATKSLSRSHRIIISSSNLVSVMGGKWTTYRRMAEDTLNKVQRHFSISSNGNTTKNLTLFGSTVNPASYPFNVYGTALPLVHAYDGADVLLHPDMPYTEAQVRYAVDHEYARTVEDILARRTNALFLNAPATLACAPKVASIIGEMLSLDRATIESQIKNFTMLAQGYMVD